MYRVFIFLFLIGFSTILKAQDERYFQHAIVNQTNGPKIDSVINFWTSFLYEENDSLQLKYWAEEEIEKYTYPCLFCGNFFQFDRLDQLKYFKPYILSVEEKNNQYFIKTAFWNFNFKPSDTTNKNQNPAGIISVIVDEIDGQFYLKNVLSYRTTDWKKYTVGKINYMIAPSAEIDSVACQKAANYSDSLANAWEVSYDSIDYYVTTTGHEIGKLLGFDFSFYGYTEGLSGTKDGFLMASGDNFFYRHELVHFVLGLYENGLFSEGLATFIGGSHNVEFDVLAKSFYEKFGPQLSKKEVEEILYIRNGENFYVFGAMICNAVYKQLGIAGLKKLSKCSKGNEKLLPFAADLLNLSKKGFLEIIFQNIG